jgi:hypothetical protein
MSRFTIILCDVSTGASVETVIDSTDAGANP